MLINVAFSFVIGLAEKSQRTQPNLGQGNGYLKRTHKAEHF